jgi:predicted enzyme related to lactoylglutathione lyase
MIVMAQEIKVIVYPVSDVEKAKSFYSAFLGTKPYVDSPYYIGYRVGDFELGLDPNSKVGPIAYIDVTDIKSSIESMVEAGAEIVQEPKDVANGLLVAQLKDADGNMIGFRQQP